MRTLTAREAGHYVGRLERIAHELEHNFDELGLNQKQALAFAYEVDSICDEIERTSRAAVERQAKLLEGDRVDPEPYMSAHFDANVNDHDADEPYMGMFSNQPGRPAADAADQVQDRIEAPVQDISKYSDGFKKQPSQPSVGGSPYPDGGRRTASLFRSGRYVRQS